MPIATQDKARFPRTPTPNSSELLLRCSRLVPLAWEDASLLARRLRVETPVGIATLKFGQEAPNGVLSFCS